MLDTASYWNRPVEGLFALLETTPDGLTSSEAARRRALFGPNALEFEEKATVLGAFASQFRNAIMLILLFATGISAVLQDWVDAAIILAIVLGSAFR